MAIEVGSRRDGQLGAGKEQEIDPEKTVITWLDLVRRAPLPSPPLPLGCVSVLPTLAATDSCYRSIPRRPDKQKTERERKVTKWRRGVPGWRATGCRHRTRKITLPLSTFRKGGERERGRLVHLALCYPPPLSPATAAATTRLFGQGSSTGVPTSFELEGALPS